MKKRQGKSQGTANADRPQAGISTRQAHPQPRSSRPRGRNPHCRAKNWSRNRAKCTCAASALPHRADRRLAGAVSGGKLRQCRTSPTGAATARWTRNSRRSRRSTAHCCTRTGTGPSGRAESRRRTRERGSSPFASPQDLRRLCAPALLAEGGWAEPQTLNEAPARATSDEATARKIIAIEATVRNPLLPQIAGLSADARLWRPRSHKRQCPVTYAFCLRSPCKERGQQHDSTNA